MKIRFKEDYKKLLVIWIACGILVSGYFYIYPVKHTVKLATANYSSSLYEKAAFGASEYSVKGKHFQVTVLVTIVGAVLIGGLGYTSKTKS